MFELGYDVRFNIYQLLLCLPESKRRTEMMDKCDVFNLTLEYKPNN